MRWSVLLVLALGCKKEPWSPCGDGPLFSYGLIDAAEVRVVSPMTQLIPADHTFPTPHMYWTPGTVDAYGTASIVAPGDLWITGGAVRAYDAFAGVPDVRDYDLDFTVCDDVTGYLIHVVDVTWPALVDAVAAEGADVCDEEGFTHDEAVNERSCAFRFRNPVHVPAGEVLGVSGNPDIRMFGTDMGLRDYRVPDGRDFISADRHCPEGTDRERCYAVQPLAYLEEASLADYLPFIGDGWGSVRTEEPVVGHGVHLDVPGTAQGYWFYTDWPAEWNGGPEYWDLFLGPDPTRSSVPAISMGGALAEAGLDPGVFLFAPEVDGARNRPFDAITADGTVYCFDNLYGRVGELDAGTDRAGAVIYAQLTSATTLSVGYAVQDACGDGPYALPSTVATYER